jgi:hypothetical protein
LNSRALTVVLVKTIGEGSLVPPRAALVLPLEETGDFLTGFGCGIPYRLKLDAG